MKHLKIAGLCLMALLALNAVATTAASARGVKPYWDQCSRSATEGRWEDNLCSKVSGEAAKNRWNKVEIEAETKTCVEVQELKTGFWEDSGCTKALATGEFVKVEQFHKYTSISGKSTLIAEKSGAEVKCEADENAGTYTGPKTLTLTVHFKECKGPLGTTCTSEKAATGEIVTAQLSGELFYISEAKEEVGVWFKATKGGVFAKFECGSLVDTVFSIEKTESGSCIAGRILPTGGLNVMTKTGELLVKGTKTAQEIETVEYEKGKTIKCRLESELQKGKRENSTQNTTSDKITGEDALELIAS